MLTGIKDVILLCAARLHRARTYSLHRAQTKAHIETTTTKCECCIAVRREQSEPNRGRVQNEEFRSAVSTDWLRQCRMNRSTKTMEIKQITK